MSGESGVKAPHAQHESAASVESDVKIRSDPSATRFLERNCAVAATLDAQTILVRPEAAGSRAVLSHEYAHIAQLRSGLQASRSMAEAAAERVASGASTDAGGAAPAPMFQTAPLDVVLKGVSVNHDRVTVPPAPGLSFTAHKSPANATGVTLSVAPDSAGIAAGTSVDSTTGRITVAADQTGGSAHIQANQTATVAAGTLTTTASAPFNFTAIPSAISGTSASAAGTATTYGGVFTHTFASPAGGQAALERAHVNEHFPAASGTMLTITGPLGTLHVTINSPNSAAAGWDLDASGTMAGPDHVTWGNTFDARAFVRNASHPTPSATLPQALTATQEFRNLNFPSRTYGAAAVASTTHRRAIEDRSNALKAVTSAGINQEVVQNYAGPTVFRSCSASPATIPVTAPAAPGAAAPAVTTATVTVQAEGVAANPTFSVRPPTLGCTINASGVLTPGKTPGTVTVRAGNAVNFDETAVTLTG